MTATQRILLGLALGAAIGIALASWTPSAAERVADAVQPLGKLWLSALQMTVVPLVLSLVVVGANTATDAAASGRVARRAIVVFLLLLALGAAVAAVAAPGLFTLFPRSDSLTAALRTTGGHLPVTAPVGWSDWLSGIVPTNAVMAAAQSAMLPLVVFAMFLGFALTRIAPERRALAVEFFRAIADAMIVVVRWVLLVAPLGVFALILSVCARAGLHMLGALGVYVLVECIVYLIVTVLMLVVARVWGHEPFTRFASAIAPAQVVAASTQSSLASLPAMIDSADRRLAYPTAVTSLVLPMAVSLFRLTSPVQYIVSASFIAWAFGIELGIVQLAAGAVLAVVVSLGSVGLPGQVTFIATNVPVAQAMGLPIGPLGIMLAVDTLPDTLATLGNVTADLAATSVVAAQSLKDKA
ncbi:Na+/H+-dicarboxylate symporter [Luteibacter jiangsuensis]|uniref:Na+/H+-dicarboxylate symporter n=1 Tax=Luteibacter jiangsuensis TaxID=637577 RepID=A0ABT9T414_9GAMM|nr:cation:dicarboxylase symporter family transporter [Luteibacter jiangsuensis]MDQ0011619.1 Na+/H+-dicarboxylate symporter [Luteibacter jiangsuensis]